MLVAVIVPGDVHLSEMELGHKNQGLFSIDFGACISLVLFFFMCWVCLLHIVYQLQPCAGVGGGKKGTSPSSRSSDSSS
jgi:hypothetical protein